jgi:Rad3-related DNA helicase
MSATILDREAFCQSLGIPADEVDFLSLPSPFPAENRPIIELPVGPMNAKEIDNTLPKMAKVVKELLDSHPDDKGIIHCHTFKIAKYLWQYVEGDRLLIHETHDRDEVLQKHMQSDKPTVLLSPSMSEGVDLRDDCSRFQIICKIPYPYLGDKVVKKRMTKWPGWYPLQTAKSIVQAVGRSIRSVDDHAVTYILDAQWRSFYGRYKKFFPADFHNCIKR